MVGVEQTVTGDSAPSGKIFGGAGVPGNQAQHLAGREGPHPAAQRKQKIAATKIPGIPFRMVGKGTGWLVRMVAGGGFNRKAEGAIRLLLLDFFPSKAVTIATANIGGEVFSQGARIEPQHLGQARAAAGRHSAGPRPAVQEGVTAQRHFAPGAKRPGMALDPGEKAGGILEAVGGLG